MDVMSRISANAKAMEPDIKGLEEIAHGLDRTGNITLGHELSIMYSHLSQCITNIKSAVADSQNISVEKT